MEAYLNPKLDTEARLDDLISRMTLEELVLQTDQYSVHEFLPRNWTGEGAYLKTEALDAFFHGSSVGSIQTRELTAAQSNALQRYAVEHTRLKIPFLFSEEALHGISSTDGTSFPQQLGLAATFDPSLGYAMGRAIATEARAKGVHETFSPVMDLGRDPRWGRTEEGFGEDTHLSAQFARETVRGLQGEDLRAPDAVAAEPKHYAAYGSPVAGLNCAPCAMPRHEVFSDSLPVFEAAIQDAGALNVMCSYTAVDNTPVSMDRELLTDVLRDQWGMRGFVRSDMTAVSRLYDWFYITDTEKEAIRLGMEAGVDLQLFDFPHERWQKGVLELVKNGRMDRGVLEQAVRRILRVKMLLGLFENPYVDESREARLVHCAAHQELSQRIAEESICLLKNEGALLPLSKDLTTIAVIGPSADRAILGDYTPHGKTGVSVLEGIKKLLPAARIIYEPGCGFLGNQLQPIPSEFLRDEEGNPGLTARYYGSPDFSGEPVLTRRDTRVDFNWTIFPPDGDLFSRDFGAAGFSVCWTGTLTSPETFDGFLGFGGEDSFCIYVDGKLLLNCWGSNWINSRIVPFAFEEGRAYALRVEWKNDQQGAMVRLGMRRSMENFAAAVEAARKSQVAIVCVGDSNDTSGENFDRTNLNLPGNQPELVKAVYESGTPVVLVMQSGRPVSCVWEQAHIPAILQCWFPGERGGHAIARTLFGDNNPSGHLPVTFPQDVGQVPCHYTRRPGGGRRYVEMGWQPLYPFGYGLSYSSFSYLGLRLSAEEIAPGESITAWVTVANTSSRAGSAVVQLYLRDWVSSTVKPLRSLAAFAKVPLAPGEEKTVPLTIDSRAMRTLGRDYIWRVEPGRFTVYLGENAESTLFEESFLVK